MLTVFILLLQTGLIGQIDKITSPSIQYYELREDFKNLISIAINENGTFYINNKISKNLEEDLYNQYKDQILNHRLNFSLVTLEIIADRNLDFHKIIDLTQILLELNFEKILFVCKSDSYERIEQIWSIGLEHFIPSSAEKQINNDFAIRIRKEMNIPPPPPPPPPGVPFL